MEKKGEDGKNMKDLKSLKIINIYKDIYRTKDRNIELIINNK